ncbi:MAG: hypothetical protein NUW00_02245 [Candidatus Kaiserbacteria bacterium]|nr:hypothetical protein [Candidatus Kaiserbacteria bacterium]
MNAIQKNRHALSKTLMLCSSLIFYFLLVSFAEAAGEYIPIVAIPGLNNQKIASLPEYINKIYFFTITIGALYGVVKIAFAGVKYSMSDIITSKESAKEDIKGVLLGLAILLIPFIVLRTINPELTRLDVLSSVSVKNKINLISGSVKDGKSTPRYQEGDLKTVGTQISTASKTSSTSSQSGSVTSNNTSNTNGTMNREILIPIRAGTEQELENVKEECRANMPGGTANFLKDPARGKYVCTNY